MTAVETSQVPAEKPSDEVQRLTAAVGESSPEDAVELLSEHSDETANEVLAGLTPVVLEEVLSAFPRSRRELILAAAPPEYRRQWMRNDTYAEDAIGRLMEPALAVCQPDATIAEATERLRDLVKRAFITYLFVVDARERLVGVVAMREMLLGRPDQTLEEIMIQDPFVLVPEMELTDAMKATVTRHYPVYPVVDGTRRLIGLLRG